MQNENSVTYVCNAGVLLQLQDKKILLDGLSRSKLPIYKDTPAQIRDSIIEGVPPFDKLDVMLITHHHSDHLHLESTMAFLERHPGTKVVSTPHVISALKSNPILANSTNLIAVQPGPQSVEKVALAGINIYAYPLTHDGSDFKNVPNLGFLIDHGCKVFHAGDAAPTEENYRCINLKQHGIDLMIANFPYIALPKARKVISEYINPQKIAVVHLPVKELDDFGWIKSAKASYERVRSNFIETQFFEELGQSMKIE